MKNENKILENGVKNLAIIFQIVSMAYLIAIIAILPLYVNLETGYFTIGDKKAQFFLNTGFWMVIAVCFLGICYIVLNIAQLYTNRKKGKLPHQIYVKKSRNRFSLTDIFVFIYVLSLIVSWLFSDYQRETLLGAEGWYMGLLSQLLLAGIYWISSRIMSVKTAKWTGCMMLVVSSIVFALTVLNRYGFDPLQISANDPGYVSTIGNINWLCGYWAVLFPVSVGMLCFYKKNTESNRQYYIRKFLLGFLAGIGFATGIIQGSASGIMALAGLLLFTGWIAGKERNTFICFWEMLLLFSVVLFLLRVVHRYIPDRNTLLFAGYLWLMETPLFWVAVFVVAAGYLFLKNKEFGEKSFPILKKIWKVGVFSVMAGIVIYVGMLTANTWNPGCLGSLSDNPLFIFDREWGSARGGTWRAGMGIWLAQDLLHKITGIGPDGMKAYLYQGGNELLFQNVREQFGTIPLTNAHGEWITILANLGVFGFTGFAGIIISAIVRFTKSSKTWCIIYAICLVSYTINNIFSFQQVMNVTQMFIILGLGEFWLQNSKEGACYPEL